jgi:hypothetical protein
MDVLCERSVTTLLTTITSNLSAIVLLGINCHIQEENEAENDDEVEKDETEEDKNHELSKKDNFESYLMSFISLLTFPVLNVTNSTKALCHLIRGLSLGMPYKYIRLLSDARYFSGSNNQNESKLDKSGGCEENCSILIDDGQTDIDNTSENNLVQTDAHKSNENIPLPTVWLPKY